MNIVAVNTSGEVYYRPDTTLLRENNDLYVPEGVDRLSFVPVLFIRLSQAGKCVQPQYAGRYFDSISFGLFFSESSDRELAFRCCIDRTTVIPEPYYNKVTLEKADNRYEVGRNGTAAFTVLAGDIGDIVAEALARASEKTSLRRGDFLAVELDCERIAAERSGEQIRFKGEWCENELFNFDIIF